MRSFFDVIKNKKITDMLVIGIVVAASTGGVFETKLFAAAFAALLVVIAALVPRIAIVVLVVMAENLFFIVNPSYGISQNRYEDVILVITFIMLGRLLVDNLAARKALDGEDEHKGRFSLLLALFVVIVIAESVNTFRINAQPVELGLRLSRYYLFYLLYFPMLELMKDEKLRRYALDFFLYAGAAACAIYLAQYALLGNVEILHIPQAMEDRFGGTRLRIETGLIITSCFIAISRALRKDESGFKYFAFAIFNFIALVVLAKTRMVAFGIIFAVAVVMMLQKKYSRAAIAYLAIALLAVNVFVAKDSMLVSLYELTVEEVSTDSGNYDVRVDETRFFMDQALENPVFGMGILNEFHQESRESLGMKYRFFVSDIGILGFFFVFGIVGVLWAAAFLLNMARLSLDSYRKGHYMPLLFTAYALFTMPTMIIFESTNMFFYVLVILAIHENVVRENA